MEKPEKIKFKDNLCLLKGEVNHANSYNQACDDWEKWIISELERIDKLRPPVLLPEWKLYYGDMSRLLYNLKQSPKG